MNHAYQFTDVQFCYGKAFQLTDINLLIKDNTITAVVGPNGSGKTSLLNLLAFLEQPGSGQMTFFGETVTKQTRPQCKKRVGYVQQNPYLLRGNVINNVELGLKLQRVDKAERDQRVTSIMQQLNIAHMSKRSVNQLSGGEAQKVAIAQALVLQPDVLILDEPFTFLDERSIQDLEQMITMLKQEMKKTIVLTTHNQIQAQLLADSLFGIVNGRLLGAATFNIFTGSSEGNDDMFNTGNIAIRLPDAVQTPKQIAIDPNQIVISRTALDSSMQNSFSGRVISLSEELHRIRVMIHAGEDFQVMITPQALQELSLSIGDEVWISFKSSSILLC